MGLKALEAAGVDPLLNGGYASPASKRGLGIEEFGIIPKGGLIPLVCSAGGLDQVVRKNGLQKSAGTEAAFDVVPHSGAHVFREDEIVD